MFLARRLGQNYAFVVVGAIFVTLLVSAGSRGAPGVLILPLEESFGWSRPTVSFAAAVGIFLYGLVGPFAVALMDRFGLRKTIIGALVLLSTAMAASSLVSQPWHLALTIGAMAGLASGCMAVTLGAFVVNRWFAAHRGLAMGVLTASTATGTLIFVPGMAAL